MSLNDDLPDDYNDVKLEIDEEIIFEHNTSIPYRYKYEMTYYPYYSEYIHNPFNDSEIPSEETITGFLYLHKLINLKKKSA